MATGMGGCIMLENYKFKEHSKLPNKKKLPINRITFDDLDEFNRIYKYCRSNYMEVKPTKSQGISNSPLEKLHSRWFCIKGNQRFELVLISWEGDYRFILENQRLKSNTIHGTTAVREIFRKADEYGIDMTKYMCDSKKGMEIKQTIESPHIEIICPEMVGKRVKNVFHMDFKSSYASRIVEVYPELYELYNFMYKQRKFKNEHYKHVLTNSIGCFQSSYCPDYITRRKTKPYSFAILSKVAVNGTRHLVERYINILKENNFVPLLTNTDGIWYYSPTGQPYHDKNEGTELCQWENDHKDCQFIMVSKGAYQYLEKNRCKTVIRGKCNLDSEEPDRDKWEFGCILFLQDICTYKLDPKKGVIREWHN